MRFCTYCGEKLRNGAKFCDKCGKPLLSQSNIKSNENKKQESKSSMPSSCPHCKVPLLLNSYYTTCPSCGFKLRNDTESHDTVQKQPKDLQTPSTCPHCGTPLNSFMLNCPACGCEVRKPKEVSSVRELALKLEKLESQRTTPPFIPQKQKRWFRFEAIYC